MSGIWSGGAFRLMLAPVVVAGGLLGGGGTAEAALTDRGGAFHGCVAKSGALRLVAPRRRCKRGERAIVFNQPQGSRTASEVSALTRRVSALESTAKAVQQDAADLRGRNASLTSKVGALEAMLAGVTRTGSTLRFTGMNLQIVSGAGATTAPPNGLGNVIIGYDEQPGEQTGSHNLVLGYKQTFTSYGGILGGFGNTITAPLASILGGEANVATAMGATVSGGGANSAAAQDATVGGGAFNAATGPQASVSGGNFNEAAGALDSVSGGRSNKAGGTYDSILGGFSGSLASNSKCGTIPAGGATC